MSQNGFIRAAVLCRLIFFLAIPLFYQTTVTLAQSPSSSRPVARLAGTIVRGVPYTADNRREEGPSAPNLSGRKVSDVLISNEERRAFSLINAQRAERGLRPLGMDAELCQMAKAHSAEMSRSNFLNHVGLDGLDTPDRARARGIVGWSALGENIAYNQGFPDPEAFAVDKWMSSGKHRANILNTMFTRSGIGIVQSSDGTYYFTQVFMAR